MEICPYIVGLRSKPYEAQLTWRRAMNYAAAVGDDNPWYFDDTREGGIVAPPMLGVALTWPLSEHYPEFWGDHVPMEIMQRQVHYTEMLVWHRPMRPGEALRIEGELAALLPHRAGTHMIVHYRATDSAGQPVFDEYSGALLRGVRCLGEGRTLGELPKIPRAPKSAEPVWEERISVDPLAAHVYDGCTDIVFPIHTSQSFAKFVGLPRTLLQGTATLSIAVREIVNIEGAGDPTRLRSVSGCFTGMVFPGTEIAVRAKAKVSLDEGEQVFFDVLNGDNRRAISEGVAILG